MGPGTTSSGSASTAVSRRLSRGPPARGDRRLRLSGPNRSTQLDGGRTATIAACVGILGHYLATHPSIQQRLREQLSQLPVAIDEILRIHPPLVASRRKMTERVEVAGRRIDTHARIALMWASANRDERVFGDPGGFGWIEIRPPICSMVQESMSVQARHSLGSNCAS